MAHIVIIAGSPTQSSRLNGLTQYAQAELEKRKHQVEQVTAAELPAEDLLRANFSSPAIQQALEKIERADAVILASPVYKAAYSGALKTILDLIPQKGFKGKVILPLFIGGTIAHLLALDYALKPVVSSLGGTNILTGIYAVDQWISRLEDGGFALTEDLQVRLDNELEELDRELQWRADSLSESDLLSSSKLN